MPRVPTVRQADLERTLRALAAQGLAPARVDITPTGVTIIPGPANAPSPALTANEPRVSPTRLDDWREGRRTRAAQGGVRADQGTQ